jgi:orotate phosphoribosyltransferase
MRRFIQNISSPYMAQLLVPHKLRQIVNKALRKLPNRKFDSIAFRGMSGAIVAPIVAMKLKKNLLMVRKTSVTTHSGCKVEGFSKSKKYIIVDDFIESGATAAHIYYEVKDFAPKAECVGLLVVSDGKHGDEPIFLDLPFLKKRFGVKWAAIHKERKREKADQKVRVAKIRAASRKIKTKR